MLAPKEVLALLEKIDKGVVPIANPCPSREDWNKIQAWCKDQINPGWGELRRRPE